MAFLTWLWRSSDFSESFKMLKIRFFPCYLLIKGFSEFCHAFVKKFVQRWVFDSLRFLLRTNQVSVSAAKSRNSIWKKSLEVSTIFIKFNFKIFWTFLKNTYYSPGLKFENRYWKTGFKALKYCKSSSWSLVVVFSIFRTNLVNKKICKRLK